MRPPSPLLERPSLVCGRFQRFDVGIVCLCDYHIFAVLRCRIVVFAGKKQMIITIGSKTLPPYNYIQF